MRLALECRADMLEMVQPFADFDFVLAHKVLEDDGYRGYYRESGKLKIVDNSVNELGEPLSIGQMKEAFEEVGGTYLVSPDFVDDAERTVREYVECIKGFPEGTVVGAVHGPTFEDAFKCLEVYRRSPVLVIPFDLCSKSGDPPWLMGLRRALFVSHIPRIEGGWVHLLGFASLDELFWYQNNPMVASIDTGVPILLGLQGLDILDPLEGKSIPTLNQMEKIELTQQGWTAVIRNIALLRRYLP